jgi:hypothetical protein
MTSLLVNASETDLLRSLIRQDARFVVVGGHAVMFHGHLRAAKDLDLFTDTARDNPSKIVSALSMIGVSHPDLTSERLSKPNQQIGVNSMFHTEILTSIAGVSFEEAFDARAYALVSELHVPVISLKHLLDTKRALARPQDLEDVAALQKDGECAL